MATKRNFPTVPYAMKNYTKSNFLISAKYRCTLLENKILAISLAKSAEFDYGKSDDSPVYSRIKVSELINYVGGNTGSFYVTLKDTAEAMTGRTIGIVSPDSRSFDFIAIVSRATCDDGIFTIEYNHAIKDILIDISKNFTRLHLPTMLRFRLPYSFRLYELIKSKCYRVKGFQGKPDDPYYIEMDVDELKLEIGVVNCSERNVRKVLKGSQTPDYRGAVEAAQDKVFVKWSEFERRVLRKAQKEINEISDILIQYEPKKSGRGGKVVGILFTVQENVVKENGLQSEAMDALIAEFGGKIKFDDMIAIANEAEGDVEKIKKAISACCGAKNVSNVVGFMISAIREGFERNGGVDDVGRAEYEQMELDFGVSVEEGGSAAASRSIIVQPAYGVKADVDGLIDEVETYSFEFIKGMVDYDRIADTHHVSMGDVDAFVSIIYDNLNTRKPTIRVGGEDKPADVVKSAFLKLTSAEVAFAIDQLNTVEMCGTKISNYDAYVTTLLYKAHYQFHLALMNQGHMDGNF